MVVLSGLVGVVWASPGLAEVSDEDPGAIESAPSIDEIAKELYNPVTALRSLGNDLEYRQYKGSLPGSNDWSAWVYQFKPSIPFQLSNGRNLLLRATIPIYLDQPVWEIWEDHPIWEVDRSYADFLLRQSPQATPDSGFFQDSHDHLADISFDVAYGGVSERGFISMFGIAALMPTSQDISASRDQFLLGPEIALGKSADWGVIGAWVTHLTDITGDSGFSTNETSLKVFFAYGLGNGWQIVSNPTILYDWEADGGNELLLPIGGGFAKTTRIGSTPVKLAFELHHYVESAERFGPEWLFTFNLTPVISKW
jgi:hypothetical protein